MLRTAVVSSLAAVAMALPQSSGSNVCRSDVSIASQADIDALSSCSTLTKNVEINAPAELTSIDLGNIQSIGGDLSITGSTIASIDMHLLNAIGGTWTMSNLTSIDTVSVGSLRTVGNINWQVLGPLLENVDFGSGTGLTSVGDLNITNTQLQSLPGITLSTANHVVIANNKNLRAFNMPLKNVTNGIVMNANGQNQFAVSLPNLVWAAGASFRNCGNVSLPSAVRINGSLEVNENTLSTFTAPKLTNIDQSLAFVSNPSLTNFSFPALKLIGGGLVISNNNELMNLNGLPKLDQVRGSVNCTGAFTNASFPALTDVEGIFNFQSSSDFDCATIKGYEGNVVKGSVTCSGDQEDPTTSTSDNGGTSSGSGSGSSGDKKNSAGTISANKVGILAFAAFVGAMIL